MASSAGHAVRRLIGRDAQLALADSMLAELADGWGGLLLLGGEPGIGKSHLALEIVDRARRRGATTAWASAWQGGGAPPLWLWAQVVHQITGSTALLDQPEPQTPSTSPAARFAQFEAITDALVAASCGQPLVVALDDLQWADQTSLRLLAFAAARARHSRCLLVATYRNDELPRSELAELTAVGTTVAVPPLDDAAAAELLAVAAGADLTPAATSAVVARSGGNPLFVWEFGQLMAQAGRFDVIPPAIPGAVVGVIRRRTARLPESAVALLQVAAVVGDHCSAALVADIAGIAPHEAVTDLDAVVTAGLLQPSADTGALAFTHGLIRDVVLDGISPDRRTLLHRRAAAVLAAGAVTDPTAQAIVADHLDRAGPAHRAEASRRWESAGRHAESLLAYEEAAVCYGRAARCRADDALGRATLVATRADALLLAGDLDGARACFAEAAEVARTHGDPALLARSVLGFGTGPVAWEVPLYDAAYAAMVEDALARLPADAVELRSALLARLSLAAASFHDVELTRDRAAQALELAERTGDPALIGQALAACNDAHAGPAHVRFRRRNADTIVELGRTARDPVLELLGHRFRVVADLELGDLAAVDRDIATFARLARSLRHPLVNWYLPLFGGMRALLDGDLDRAARRCAEVAAAAAETGSVNAELLARTLELAIDVTAGRRPRRDIFDDVPGADPAEWASYGAAVAMVKWYAGDRDLARELLAIHTGNGFATLDDDGLYLWVLVTFGRIAAESDQSDSAGAIYELLAPHAGLWVVDGIAACTWGPVELHLGRLALAAGRAADARRHLARARQAIEAQRAHVFEPDLDALERRCDDPSLDARRRAPAVPEAANTFRLDGQVWTLTYEGRTVHLGDSKGLRDLARLLAEPGLEHHVLDLAGTPVATGSVARAAAAGRADLGEVLDARARASYRRRLDELDDVLAEAEANADLGRVEWARAERDVLAHELAAAVGLGGRPRRAGDPAERARKAVTGRIRLAIGRIGTHHPALARHLTNSVRTGTYCVYRPEHPTTWDR